MAYGAIILAIIVAFIFTDIPKNFLIYFHSDWPISWNTLGVFFGFYESVIRNNSFQFYLFNILFYAFIIGTIVILFKIGLFYDKLKKVKPDAEDLEFKSNILNILLILGMLFVFVFIMRAALYEFRWFFPLLPALLAFTAKGIISTAEFLQEYIQVKYFVPIFIILILAIGGYNQIIHADNIIKMKVNSYEQVRDAAIWLKQNYEKDEQILTISYPQTVYYSEMKVFSYSEIENETSFNQYLLENKPKFLEVSGFENHPTWINSWLENNQNKTRPIRVYYADARKTQPLLIIYEIIY